jgi:hypothetical protein
MHSLPATESWWSRDEDACGYCVQFYAASVEYRCSACDHAVCPHCVVYVRQTQEFFCPACHAEENEQNALAVGEGDIR